MTDKSYLLEQWEQFNSMRNWLLTSESAAVKAIRSDDVVELRRLIDEGTFQLSEMDQDQNTPLHLAAIFKGASVTNFLLSCCQVDVDARNGEGWTALHVAAGLSRSLEVTERLLAAGAGPGLAPLHGITALHLLLNCPRPPPQPEATALALRLLEHVGGQGEAQDRGPPSLLHSAALGDAQLLAALLHEGAEVNRQSLGGHTPLHVAAALGSLEAVHVLLEAGADANLKNDFGFAPVRAAALLRMDAALVHLLVAHGAEIDSTDLEGQTALHDAAQSGNEAAASLLLDSGANLESCGESKDTPLHLALTKPDSAPMTLLLLRRGADPNSVNLQERTPLHVAALQGSEESAAALLWYGADPDCVDEDDTSPFMYAIEEKHVGLQHLLFELEPDMDRVSRYEESTLALAARYDSPLVWDVLDRGGSLVIWVDSHADVDNRSYDCKMILERTGLEDFPCGDLDNPFGVAVCKGLDELLRYMLESPLLPALLDDAYARRDQGLLTVDDLGPPRGPFAPAITGLLDFMLETLIDEGECEELIWLLLSYGYEPDSLEAYLLFCRHGRCPLFTHLVESDLAPWPLPKDSLMATLILDVSRPVRHHVEHFLRHELPNQHPYQLRPNLETMYPFITHGELFRTARERLGLPRPPDGERSVPTLQELCRDAVRDAICAALPSPPAYALYRRRVAALSLGALRGLVMYQRPLYPDPHL